MFERPDPYDIFGNPLDLNDLSFDLLAEMEDSESGSVNKRPGGRTRIEEMDIFDLMICRGMAVTVNNGIHFIEFLPDA
jgi:uncharacterized protein YukJ